MRRSQEGAQIAERRSVSLASERAATGAQRRWPEANLLADLHHGQVPFRLVVVERHAGMFKEAHDLLVALLQTDEQIERLAPLDSSSGSRWRGGRFGI